VSSAERFNRRLRTPPPFKIETQVNSCISPLRWDDEFPSHFYSLLYNKKKCNLISVYFQHHRDAYELGTQKVEPFWSARFCHSFKWFSFDDFYSVSRARALVSYQCENIARLGANLACCQSVALLFFLNKHKGLQPFWLLPSSSSLMTMMRGLSYIFKLRAVASQLCSKGLD